MDSVRHFLAVFELVVLPPGTCFWLVLVFRVFPPKVAASALKHRFSGPRICGHPENFVSL